MGRGGGSISASPTVCRVSPERSPTLVVVARLAFHHAGALWGMVGTRTLWRILTCCSWRPSAPHPSSLEDLCHVATLLAPELWSSLLCLQTHQETSMVITVSGGNLPPTPGPPKPPELPCPTGSTIKSNEKLVTDFQ